MSVSAKQLRITYRMFFETIQDIWRGGWSNYVVISILTSVLAIFGFVLQITQGLNFISQKLSDQLEFSVYLSDEVDLKDFSFKIGKMPYVKRVEVIDKEIAWHEFKKNFVISDEFDNPLPNTVHIRVNSQDYLNQTIAFVKNIPGVIDINYAPGVLGFINKFKTLLMITGYLLTVLLAFVTIVITGNTIQLVIQSRKSEIEILRLMGVDDLYIKGPLVLQGVFYATVAATIAITPLFFMQKFLWETAQNLIGGALPTGLPQFYMGNLFHIYLILLVIGVLVTGSGCFWSSRKYLRI